MPPTRLIGLLALTLLAPSCGGDADTGFDGPVMVDMRRPPVLMLSELRLLDWDGETFTYNDRVVPYDMNTPLFTDYALKHRALYIPDGTAASFVANGALDFPVGTVLLKSFLFPADFRSPAENLTLIETRVMILYEDGWETWPYVWNAEHTDARLTPAGQVSTIDFVDADGVPQTSGYVVPQRNQCQECHEVKDGEETFITPLGPTARNLHRDFDFGGTVGVQNQLSHLGDLGMLTGLPPLDEIVAATDFSPIERGGHGDLSDVDLDTAARDYLDVNCGHCHNPRGVQGITSQLFLNWDNDDDFNLGVCKLPGSAGAGTGGLVHDIVPGDADSSILVFRVETDEIGAMMPLIGRSLVHDRGAALLREWVDRMPPRDCDAASTTP